jgi:hypothetical protein
VRVWYVLADRGWPTMDRQSAAGNTFRAVRALSARGPSMANQWNALELPCTYMHVHTGVRSWWQLGGSLAIFVIFVPTIPSHGAFDGLFAGQ